jgi:hypothetical protein
MGKRKICVTEQKLNLQHLDHLIEITHFQLY